MISLWRMNWERWCRMSTLGFEQAQPGGPTLRARGVRFLIRRILRLLAIGMIISQARGAEEGDGYEWVARLSGAQADAALKDVVKRADFISALPLFAGAQVAHGKGRFEDAGFLFHAGLMRVHYDREMFPPLGTGGDSPMLVFGALQQTLGPDVQSDMADRPAVYAAVVKRLKSWRPRVAANYSPGWEHAAPKSAATTDALILPQIKERLAKLEALASLLQDKEYFAAFQTAKRLNLSAVQSQANPELNTAVQTMRRLEEARGGSGFSSALPALASPSK